MRKNHPAAAARRSAHPRDGDDRTRRGRHHLRPARPSRNGDRVSELRPVREYERPEKRRVRAEDQKGNPRDRAGARRRNARRGRALGVREGDAEKPVGRAAAAGRDRADAGAPTRRDPLRRADVGARRGDAALDAARTQTPARDLRDDDDLRHARPGGGVRPL